MHIREHVVRCLGDLIEATTPNEPDPETGRFRPTHVFRGGGANGRLHSSLDRLGNNPHEKANLEGHILRNFRRYAHPYLHHQHSAWEMLVIARHHGLPTRLLDWSYSPLVAAHFATAKAHQTDRLVWQLDWKLVHEHYGIKPLALLVEDVDALLEERGTSLEQLLSGETPEHVHFACLFEPPSLDARLVAQMACFMLLSDKTRPADAFLQEEGLGHALVRYRIPVDALGRMRDQLDLCGVDERRLFPDLDGLAAQLQRYYS